MSPMSVKPGGRFWAGNVPRIGDVIHDGEATLYVRAMVGFVWHESMDEPTFRVTATTSMNLTDPPPVELEIRRVRTIHGQTVRSGQANPIIVEWRAEVERDLTPRRRAERFVADHPMHDVDVVTDTFERADKAR